MATQEFFEDDTDGAFDAGGFMSAAFGWAGALTSLALIAGLGLWAYDLAMRDANGVPVVRALEGPARVAPENPGGFEAAHQGLAVNSIASLTEEPLADRVMLAPEDAKLTEADQPPAALTPEKRDEVLRSAVDAALGDVLGGAETEVSPNRPAATVSTGGDGPKWSPRPQSRPDPDLVTRASATVPIAVAEPASAELATAAITPGTRLVQLGAFDTAEEARVQWDQYDQRFQEYMSGKQRVVETAAIGDRVFYRLRAHGFDDLAEARNFCAIFIAEKIDCIPVLTR